MILKIADSEDLLVWLGEEMRGHEAIVVTPRGSTRGVINGWDDVPAGQELRLRLRTDQALESFEFPDITKITIP